MTRGFESFSVLRRLHRRASSRRRRIAEAGDQRRSARKARSLYRHFVKKGDLCFDVGANVGNRTSIFIAIGARVVAVEPQPACVAELRARFGDTRRLEIVEAALGGDLGMAELMLARYSTVASLSPQWVERVRQAGRFDYDWNERLTVPLTTLDALIDVHGVPEFCKIDVEGYELEVLRGLTRPVPALSFEVTPEHVDVGIACVQYLAELGLRRFAFSVGETLELGTWLDAEGMNTYLTELPLDGRLFGDVYAVTA